MKIWAWAMQQHSDGDRVIPHVLKKHDFVDASLQLETQYSSDMLLFTFLLKFYRKVAITLKINVTLHN